MVAISSSRIATGSEAECAVVALMTSWGWQVLERNVHVSHYELDIIAREARTLVVVEVRFRGRGSLTSGFGSLSMRKRHRVRWAGERLWHSRFRNDASLDHLRFDAASVHLDATGQMVIEYAVAAF